MEVNLFKKTRSITGKSVTGKMKIIAPAIQNPKLLCSILTHPLKNFLKNHWLPRRIPRSDQQKTDGSYFLDFKKAAFAKLKIELNLPIEDSILISVGEMKQKKNLSIDAQAGRNIRYHQSHLKLKPGTHWKNIPWPEKLKEPANRFYDPNAGLYWRSLSLQVC